MALELSKITQQVDALGESTWRRLEGQTARLPLVQATLNAMVADPARLQRQIAEARKWKWFGMAVPSHEPANKTFSLPELPARYNVVAADGSQIYPDRHGLALYYLVNVGSLVMRMGTGKPPEVSSVPQLYYEDQDLYFEDEDFLITSERVNAMRDAAEVAELARLARPEQAAAPSVTMIDGGLRLASNAREQSKQFIEAMRQKYLGHLDDVKASGATLAGVIDRSSSFAVIKLLNLATLEPDEINQQTLDTVDAFPGAIDVHLFKYLKFGERSALFTTIVGANDIYSERGHQVYFFYLNAGQAPSDPPLRVEVPEWVAQDSTKVDLLHASLVEQSRNTGGYPYAFTRAHEIARVTPSEQQAFEEMLVAALIKRGVAPTVSQKARGKAMLGRRR
jgi:hypothetical protein